MNELTAAFAGLTPHAVAVALIGARLIPVAYLCPMLGGSHAPGHVKLGLVLALALSLHVAGGVTAPADVTNAWTFVGLGVRELTFGLALGLIAGLPFDAARIGGRFIDLFRGSSAEAALPLAGTREAASGDALYHLLLGLGATGIALPLLLTALWRSFGSVHLGAAISTESAATAAVALVGQAFATGLAVGAPIAGVSLAVDATIGLVSRAAPQMQLKEVATPLRILAGGAVFWLALGVIAGRLTESLVAAPTDFARLWETLP